jgi:hypothetical protein
MQRPAPAHPDTSLRAPHRFSSGFFKGSSPQPSSAAPASSLLIASCFDLLWGRSRDQRRG